MPPPPPGAPIAPPVEPVAEAKPAAPEPQVSVVQAPPVVAAAPVPPAEAPPPPPVPVAELKAEALAVAAAPPAPSDAPPPSAAAPATSEPAAAEPATPATADTPKVEEPSEAKPAVPEAAKAEGSESATAADPEAPKAEATEQSKPAEAEGAKAPETAAEEPAPPAESAAATPDVTVPAAPPVPAVPLGTRVRQYLDHSYTHDGSTTAANHAFVISWLVVVSLLLLVLEGAPEFKKFSDGSEATATPTVEATATPDLQTQLRAVVQEEISRSRANPGSSELPTVTPQPTVEPTPTPTEAEAAAASAITRNPWFELSTEVEGPIHFSFILLEGLIAALFTIDYVLNARYEKRWRDYVLGLWGIIDLIAILPFFVVLANYLGYMGDGELPTWVVFLQGLRILRSIKLFRVVSETKTENSLGEVVEGSTLHRDILFGCLAVFGAVAILEVFGWTGERNLFWLVLGMASAITVAFRRWCMHGERGGASALVVVASLIIGTALSVAQDRAGDQSVAEWTAVYTVLFVTISWLNIEAKEGAL